MARDEAMHQLLLEWAQWVMVGNGSGFPTLSVLHQNWSPPSPGMRPAFKTSGASVMVRRVHGVVAGMSERLRETVCLVYWFPSLGVAEYARRLGVAERTVHERVAKAHAVLRESMDARNEFRIMRKRDTVQAS